MRKKYSLLFQQGAPSIKKPTLCGLYFASKADPERIYLSFCKVPTMDPCRIKVGGNLRPIADIHRLAPQHPQLLIKRFFTLKMLSRLVNAIWGIPDRLGGLPSTPDTLTETRASPPANLILLKAFGIFMICDVATNRWCRAPLWASGDF